MKHIAIFASGNGSNAQNLIEYFNLGKACNFQHVQSLGAIQESESTSELQQEKSSRAPLADIAVIICNKPDAYVLTRAKELGVPSVVLQKEELTTSPQTLLQTLKEYNIDYIVLAGYLLKIPTELIHEYPNKIINIHPALLPAYGGKGMYGRRVHEAVVAAGEKESGITIHLVDEQYDSGKILFQAKCQIDPTDTAEDLERKIHHLEQANFSKVVDKYIN